MSSLELRKQISIFVPLSDWKAIRLAPGRPLELYDVVKDPGEKDNVAAANPAVVARVEEYLKTARTESKEFPIREPKKK